jgi:hypothetical protein
MMMRTSRKVSWNWFGGIYGAVLGINDTQPLTPSLSHPMGEGARQGG